MKRLDRGRRRADARTGKTVTGRGGRATRRKPSSPEKSGGAKVQGPARGKQRAGPGQPAADRSPPEATEVRPREAGARPRTSAFFPIVGIGASAGGLEALEQFLGNVPPGSGMAYVVIQHLDPTHKGVMVELLQRAAAIPVVEVKDRQKVEPNCVYVIPPNKDMSILHGVLHLLPQSAPRGLNLPIDFFFRSLAEDQQERSIGVVLSGMGSDGTLGLRAIKEKAGAGFVQSLATAKFTGMPRSAIEAGLADVVAAADELPARIVAYQQHAPYISRPEATLEQREQGALEKIFVLLRTQTGNDFSRYKRSNIYRRIDRRMGLHQIDSISNYVRYLRENPHEVELLFKELLIGVTSFFRDPSAWDHLKRDVLPDLFRSRMQSGVLRVWVPGCSTGEEAYSLGMVLAEANEQLAARALSFQIFATDLDREAIEKARQGIYPANIVADISPERLRRFFLQDERGYRVRKEIREMVVFAPQNIIMDPPFTKLDILSCRNLLIYLSPEVQKKLIPLFHYALNPGGLLFLGSAETVGAHSGLFAPLDGRSRIYRRVEPAMGAPTVEFPPSFALSAQSPVAAQTEHGDVLRVPPLSLTQLADRVVIQHFAPAAMLTNDKGDILYISGRTGKYLEPARGKANLNVFAMAREGLRYELSSAFATALRQEGPVTVRAVKVGSNGGVQTVDLTVQKLLEPKELRGTMIIAITDLPSAPRGARGKPKRAPTSSRLVELEREVQHAREELQSAREQMQTSQEELKSINEELQSTNEELQSTNEELTTSKEEMQSMNEELQTVNQELQSKVDELSRSNNDMKNLLNSTDIATLFLDGELLVRRFTNQTARLIKLIPGDAGRPITDIATDLDYPGLADDAREVLRTLVFKERQVPSRDGRWFSVRILPYRTLENVIDGVVITFTDATSGKLLETTLREQANQLRQMAESLPNLVWGCRPDGVCDYVSQQWVDYTGVSEPEQLGYGWLDQVHPDERDRVRDEWKASVRAGTPLDVEFRIRGKNGQYRWFKTRAVAIRDQRGAVVKWYCTCTDVDDLKRAAEERVQAAALLASILEGTDDAYVGLDDQLAVTHFNPAAERMFECARVDVLGKALLEALPSSTDSIDQKIRQALHEHRELTFQGQLGRQRPESCKVRVSPHAGGVSLFCRRDQTHSPSPEGE
jgi:two-component system CheB/CheR fusion protein